MTPPRARTDADAVSQVPRTSVHSLVSMLNEVLQCDWRAMLHRDVGGLASRWVARIADGEGASTDDAEASDKLAPKASLQTDHKRLFPPGKIVHLYRTKNQTGLVPTGKRGSPLYLKQLMGRCFIDRYIHSFYFQPVFALVHFSCHVVFSFALFDFVVKSK
jgi:hypothetical protein